MKEPLRILHIEDDAADAELIASALESGGISCKIDRIETRKAFLDAILSDMPYDLILSDYVLPSFDGMTALLLALDNCPDVPFILLSGVLGEEIAIDAMKQGATDYVLKDRLSRLVPAVTRAVKESEEHERLKIATEEKEAMRKQLQQAQKMEAIGMLAGGVAHDFNNLLTAILGFGRLAIEALKDNDTVKEYITEIVKDGDSAARLTRQLLSFSKKQLLQIKLIDPNSAINGVKQLLRHTIGEDVDLVIKLTETKSVVKADISQYEQVLMNLVVNSREAMPTGGRIEIKTDVVQLDDAFCSLHKPLNSGEHFLLSVKDNGPGISDDIRDLVFDPFFTTKELGTGLGLSTVYGIVESFNGCMVLEENMGIGTEFNIYLPCVNGDPEISVASIDASLEGNGENILLVEDENIVRKVAKQMLEKIGYKVVDAGSPLEAIDIFTSDKERFDLIVTDMVMPGMSGTKMVKELKTLRSDIKALYVSGYVSDKIIESVASADGGEILLKPYTRDDLALRISEILD